MIISRSLLVAFIAMLYVLLSPRQLLADNYYVSNSGSDNNDGASITSAWKTIQFAVDNPTVKPGDTINILPGAYTESVTIDGAKRGRCGADGQYVTLKGYDLEDKPILTGDDLSARLKIYNCSYYKVEGLHFKDFNGGGLLIMNQLDQTVVHNIEVRNNIFENQDAQIVGTDWWTTLLINGGYGGLDNRSMENVLVEDNYFKNVRPGAPTNYNEIIAVEGNARRVVIQRNMIEKGYYIAIVAKGEVGPACGNCDWDIWQSKQVVIRNNTIKDTVRPGTESGSVGIYIEGARDILVEGNVVQNNSVGISLGNEPRRPSSPPLYFKHYLVRNNHVVAGPQSNIALKLGEGSCGWADTDIEKDYYITHNVLETKSHQGDGGLAVIGFSDAENVYLKNNVMYRTEGNGIYDSSRYAQNRNWNSNGNLFYGPNGQTYFDWDVVNGCGIFQYLTFDEYTLATHQDIDSFVAEPVFVDQAAGDYRLAPGAVGYQEGIDLTYTTDTGEGRTISVEDAQYFYDGWGIPGETGDTILVGSNRAIVVDVDYDRNMITVDRDLAWNANTPVNYYHGGDRPSIGLLFAAPDHQTSPLQSTDQPSLMENLYQFMLQLFP